MDPRDPRWLFLDVKVVTYATGWEKAEVTRQGRPCGVFHGCNRDALLHAIRLAYPLSDLNG